MQLKLVSLLGLAVFIGLAWAMSANRKRFPWRAVLWGLGLQFLFGFLILRTKPGDQVFNFFQRAVTKLIGFADEGSKMVFGPLANTDLLTEKFGPDNSFVFVITVTATIILVAALSSLLYHYGVLQLVVRGTRG